MLVGWLFRIEKLCFVNKTTILNVELPDVPFPMNCVQYDQIGWKFAALKVYLMSGNILNLFLKVFMQLFVHIFIED